MKVIFLDFDGVLNTATYRAWWRRNPALRIPDAELCPALVANVNHIIAETGAKVVLSTAWRTYTHLRPHLVDYLRSAGFEGTVIGMTPDFTEEVARNPYRTDDGGLIHATRGMEIKAWLDDHPEVASYVVLEDSEDMTPLPADRIVWTTDRDGLTQDRAQKAIEILNR